ncbi:protein translocase subunit SecD [Desulfosarcina cetonica]|uniref:protein translocase subunit SecD n=1 Tax=Desulfosarcina cetonica TaxID=90730 RepID=UPI000B0AA3E9|nr:protein translocase subunit SecD [Desulfosarcina cetonica]
MKNLSWKLILIAAVILAAVIYVIPTLRPGIWPHKKINLGLDLQGGMHLVLEVQTDKAVENTVERLAQDMRDMLREERIRTLSFERLDNLKIAVKVPDEANIAKFDELLDKDFRELRIVDRTVKDNVLNIVLDLPEKEIEHIRQMAVAQALETIRNRIDQFGVSEPDIRIQGQQRILVQLPGVNNTERAKDLIGKTALLEFKLVDDTHDIQSALAGNVPPGEEILYEVREDKTTHRVQKTPLLVKKRAALTGAYLTDASVKIGSQYNDPYVSITFDKKGARLFERVTGENVKKRLAIVLDGTIYSAPVIQDRIAGGEASITGSFTADEARDLAIVLRAGALPAPVKILEERTVGPSLGTDSIRMGLLSMVVGGILVVLFMAVYYKISGWWQTSPWC